MKLNLTLLITCLLYSCAWDSDRGAHMIDEDVNPHTREHVSFYQCEGENQFGKYPPGGGCNVFGCWIDGGSCNEFGCSVSGTCSLRGCQKPIKSIKCVGSL
ncbi:MAG: hypothetical protein HOM21_01645 [Halobacteriovoraceae bacterium]|jgi:hypothetical protein|nr:hypothetical protein [Halobacteriovoraceae bacterium]